ncbi:hypothetical protein AmDm5_0086 [Acetobacter malorum]|nr:hypothetical protein AmDm5_0086 [Acetobacter malorum]
MNGTEACFWSWRVSKGPDGRTPVQIHHATLSGSAQVRFYCRFSHCSARADAA